MTTESNHHISGRWPVAIALAASAGFTDAFVYLNVAPVFVANMSGNLVRVGIAIGAGDGHVVAASAIALGGFALGAALASTHADRHVTTGTSPRAPRLLLIESALIVAVAGLMAGFDIHPSARPDVVTYAAILAGALAMGIQAIALRRVGSVAVSTTYGTGAVVRLSEKLALALRQAERPGAERRRTTVTILLTILFAYVGGSAAAAFAGSSPAFLLIPAAIPIAAALRRPGAVTR
jgi:uncharacterized membrane protein YoaK (UPF0700 family)